MNFQIPKSMRKEITKNVNVNKTERVFHTGLEATTSKMSISNLFKSQTCMQKAKVGCVDMLHATSLSFIEYYSSIIPSTYVNILRTSLQAFSCF